MVEELVTAGVTVASAGAFCVTAAARVVKQYERGVAFWLGRLRPQVREPGFTLIVPFVDRLHKVNLQVVTMPVPAQEGITRDNVTVRVDAGVHFNADAELRASKKLAEAAQQMSETPSALQLRLLQTIVAVAAEKNSTLVLPFPVELLRFLERAQQPAPSAPEAVREQRPPAASLMDPDHEGSNSSQGLLPHTVPPVTPP
jgi:regulator of protease activity HflC (stomatin/prohibitin superfamily)